MFDFLHENLQTCLGVPSTGSCKMRCNFFFSPPLGKSLNNIKEYESLSLVDTSFALETARGR